MISILVIDEEKISINGIKFYLELNFPEIKIFIARTCSEGMEILENQYVDLIVLDMMLPKGNMNFVKERIDFKYGIDMLVELRARNYDLPIICYTIIDNDEALIAQIYENDAIHICKLSENATNDLIKTIKQKLNVK